MILLQILVVVVMWLFLKLSDKFALESALEHMDNAYVNFYNKLKENKTKVVSKGKRKGKLSCFLKFVSKYKPNGNSYTTKFTNNNIELLQKDNIPYVKLPKVGLVRFTIPLGKTLEDLVPNNTRITSATIKRSTCNVTKNTVFTIYFSNWLETLDFSRVSFMKVIILKNT